MTMDYFKTIGELGEDFARHTASALRKRYRRLNNKAKPKNHYCAEWYEENAAIEKASRTLAAKLAEMAFTQED